MREGGKDGEGLGEERQERKGKGQHRVRLVHGDDINEVGKEGMTEGKQNVKQIRVRDMNDENYYGLLLHVNK